MLLTVVERTDTDQFSIGISFCGTIAVHGAVQKDDADSFIDVLFHHAFDKFVVGDAAVALVVNDYIEPFGPVFTGIDSHLVVFSVELLVSQAPFYRSPFTDSRHQDLFLRVVIMTTTSRDQERPERFRLGGFLLLFSIFFLSLNGEENQNHEEGGRQKESYIFHGEYYESNGSKNAIPKRKLR